MQIADSHTFENPRREFRTPKGWHAARACQAARASAAVARSGGGPQDLRGRAWQVKSVEVTSGQDMEDQDKSGQVKTGHVT